MKLFEGPYIYIYNQYCYPDNRFLFPPPPDKNVCLARRFSTYSSSSPNRDGANCPPKILASDTQRVELPCCNELRPCTLGNAENPVHHMNILACSSFFESSIRDSFLRPTRICSHGLMCSGVDITIHSPWRPSTLQYCFNPKLHFLCCDQLANH